MWERGPVKSKPFICVLRENEKAEEIIRLFTNSSADMIKIKSSPDQRCYSLPRLYFFRSQHLITQIATRVEAMAECPTLWKRVLAQTGSFSGGSVPWVWKQTNYATHIIFVLHLTEMCTCVSLHCLSTKTAQLISLKDSTIVLCSVSWLSTKDGLSGRVAGAVTLDGK